ncbi:MAG TPA: cytochrome c [Usitatibacteraceae bacterium]|nr:cytochrome c [Usitatibacteraceae bacterium]
MRTNRSSRLPLVLAAALLLCAAWTVGAADLSNGARLYEVHCAQCHGKSGEGVMPGAPKFNRGERLLQPDPVLMATILRGKNAMPPFLGVLREREILDVIAHLRTLQKFN